MKLPVSQPYEPNSLTSMIFVAQRCDKSNDLHVLVFSALIVDNVVATQFSLLTLSHSTFRVDEALISRFKRWI